MARSPNEAFAPADRRLLEGLARQAGVAAYAVRLTTDLQRSRERLVAAREEERRRLRRDLHDGLSAQLAGLNAPGRDPPAPHRARPGRPLVAEDHPLFRKGMISLLSSVPDFEVVGEASTGEEAVARAAELQPDVVLMDLQMPEVNGIEATRRILQESPNIRVLVVTLFEDDDSVFMALRAGARGYVLKDADEEEEEMVLAIRAVGRGEPCPGHHPRQGSGLGIGCVPLYGSGLVGAFPSKPRTMNSPVTPMRVANQRVTSRITNVSATARAAGSPA